MAKRVRAALRAPASTSHGRTTVRRTMINRQLAVIAAASHRRQQALPITDENRLLLKILLRSWSRTTTRVSGLRARERAWRAVRSERLLENAVAVWHNWAQKSRADDAEWAARVAMIQKQRLSRALVHFKESCKNSKRHRRLKLGLRTVRELSEWRPTKGRWCRWKAFLQKARVKEAFSAWVKASQRERRIGEAAHVIRARKEASVMVDVWNAWRRAAGAAKLGWLLGAWGVIGPMRSAVEVMQASAKMARAEQWRRLHLLRRGLHFGFTEPTTSRRKAKTAAARARKYNQNRVIQHGFCTLARKTAVEVLERRKDGRVAKECRKRTLRKGLDRWMVRHRSVLLVKLFQRRLDVARILAGIKTWAGKTALSRTARMLKQRTKSRALASCMERFQRNVAHRRAHQKSSAAAAANWRHSRIGHGLTCWCSRGRVIRQQQRCQGEALAFHRLGSLRRGMACIYGFTEQQTRARHVIRAKNSTLRAGAIARWREVVREFSTNCKATSSHQTRCLSSAISSWRVGVSRLHDQRDLAQAARVYLHRRSLGVSFTRWRKRVDIESCLELTVQRFQRHHHFRLGLSGLHRWTKKRGSARLSAWRTQVWAGAFRATCALRKWRKHVKSEGDLEASFRIAESRRFKSENLRRRGRCFSPLAKHVFRGLRDYAGDMQLKRRLLEAWLAYAKALARAGRQDQSFRVRSGLRGLRTWMELSKHMRERRLRALNHSNRRVTRSFLRAWKSTVFPLGLRVEWESLRVCAHPDGAAAAQEIGFRILTNNKGNAVASTPCDGIAVALDEGGRIPNNKGNAPNASRDQEAALAEGVNGNGVIAGETGSLEPKAKTTTEQDGNGSNLVQHDSLVLLRLPMVGQRMRRVLQAWRKLAKKGKRLNYIRDMLPKKMGHVCPGPGPSPNFFKETNNGFRNLDCGERENSENTLKLKTENSTARHENTVQKTSGKGTGCHDWTLKARSEKCAGYHNKTLKTGSEKGAGCRSASDNAHGPQLLKTAEQRTGRHRDRGRGGHLGSAVGYGRRSGAGCRSDRADFLIDAVRGGSGKSSGGSYLERYLSAEIAAQERACKS